jgi:hypothetical protein
MPKKKNFQAIQYLKILNKLGININEKENTQKSIKFKKLDF